MPTHFIGIDLGARRTQVCITTEDGTVLTNTSVASRLDVILALAQRHGATACPVAIEATFAWYWLADGLQDHGYEVHLVHAARCAAITTAKVKTDRRDAATLAQLLRAGLLPEAYLYPRAQRGTRDLVRQRHAVVERRSGVLRKIRCLLYREGHVDHDLDDAKHLDADDLMTRFADPMVRFHAQTLIDEQAHLLEIQTRIEKILLDQAEETPQHALLRSIPGIGKILSLVIGYEIGDIRRFRSIQGFCSYCRVAPGIAQSGNSVRHGRANKAGNPHLKRSFHQAAVLACSHEEGWKHWRDRLLVRHAGQGGKMKATNAVAHRLARIVFRILLSGKPYEETLARLA